MRQPPLTSGPRSDMMTAPLMATTAASRPSSVGGKCAVRPDSTMLCWIWAGPRDRSFETSSRYSCKAPAGGAQGNTGQALRGACKT